MRIRLILLSPFALVFLVLGVYMLVTSFYQDHPGAFMALFFSSSLIILISAVCLVGLFFHLKPVKEDETGEMHQ